MKQQSFLVAIILGSLVIILLFTWRIGHIQPPPDKFELSAGKGVAWLMDYKGQTLDPAILWMMQNINNNYCGGIEGVKKEISQRAKEFTEKQPQRAFLRLLLGGDGDMPSDKYIASIPNFNDVMIRALYCDKRQIPAESLKRMFSIEQAEKYDLTHYLWAMQILKDRSCSIPAGYDINALMQKAAERIVVEEDRDTIYGDLFAERIAFLEYMGFENLVRPEWYDKLVSIQQPSGGWSNPGLLSWEHDPNPHITSLAVWALAQRTKTCPFVKE